MKRDYTAKKEMVLELRGGDEASVEVFATKVAKVVAEVANVLI